MGDGGQRLCYLDVGTGVNLVDGVTRSSSSLAVQIIALDKHSVVTETAHPHVPLAFTLQLNTFTDVKPAGQKTQRALLVCSSERRIVGRCGGEKTMSFNAVGYVS